MYQGGGCCCVVCDCEACVDICVVWIGSTGVVAGDFEGEVSQNVALEGVGDVGVVSSSVEERSRWLV